MYEWVHTGHVQTTKYLVLGVKQGFSALTRVSRDVLPDPLGPISRIDGKAVNPLARKTKKCRKSGIVRTKTMPIARPRGDGLMSVTTISAKLDMIKI